MKKNKLFIAGKCCLPVLISFLFLACDKNQDSSDFQRTNATLKISIKGIQQSQALSSKLSARVQRTSGGGLIEKKLQEFDDFEVQSYLSYDPIAENISRLSHGSTDDLRANTPANTENLSQGISYRVELFKLNQDNSKTHWRTINRKSQVAATGTDTVGVVQGDRYIWYAYSYNTADDITVSHGNLQVSMGNNKDFLFALDTIEINSTGNQSIDIIFERKTARIAVDVDAKGIFADNIRALSITVPSVLSKTANFNLENNAIVSSTIHDGISQLVITDDNNDNNDDFHNVANESNHKRAYIYTIAPVASQTVSLPMTQLSTQRGATTTAYITSGGTPVSFSFSNFTLDLGETVTARMHIMESGVVDVEGVVWARSNLYRRAATGSDLYRFWPVNEQTSDPRGFFSFRGHIPGKWGVKGAAAIDPCALVYPAHRWKTPTNADFVTISDDVGLLGGLVANIFDFLVVPPNLKSTLGTNYLQYAGITSTNNTHFASDKHQLRFYFNGIATALNVLGDGWVTAGIDVYSVGNNIDGFSLLNFNLGLVDSRGQAVGLWTREDMVGVGLSISGVNLLSTQLGALGYFGRRKEVGIPNPLYNSITAPLLPQYIGGGTFFSRASRTTEILNLDVGILDDNLNVLSSTLKNIRCVRDATWTTRSATPGYNPNPTY